MLHLFLLFSLDSLGCLDGWLVCTVTMRWHGTTEQCACAWVFLHPRGLDMENWAIGGKLLRDAGGCALCVWLRTGKSTVVEPWLIVSLENRWRNIFVWFILIFSAYWRIKKPFKDNIIDLTFPLLCYFVGWIWFNLQPSLLTNKNNDLIYILIISTHYNFHTYFSTR